MAVTTEMIKALREITGAGVLDCKKALDLSNGDFDEATAFLREKGLAAAAKKADRVASDGLVGLHVDASGRHAVILEVNCETDFVARTEDFQTFFKALLNQLREDGGVTGVPDLLARPYGLNRDMTVGQHVTDMVSKLGENLVIRRLGRLDREGSGWIEGYLHPGNRIGVILLVSAGSEDVAGGAAFRELAHDLALQVAAAEPLYVAPSDIPAAELETERSKFLAQVAQEKKPDHIKERIVAGKLEKWYETVCLLRQPYIRDDSVRIADLIAQKSQQWGVALAVERFIRFELGKGE